MNIAQAIKTLWPLGARLRHGAIWPSRLFNVLDKNNTPVTLRICARALIDPWNWE